MILSAKVKQNNKGGAVMAKQTKKSQWKAKHKKTCTDQSQYAVFMEYGVVQDIHGTVLQSGFPGDVESAECECCGAKANFE